ncbi:MAG: SurA N-terminal domain-containing protein [Methylobacteriaceae bacterium]|nr:SurA N-terminal domain-containing protein [Methylobacteriaceae bacterium]
MLEGIRVATQNWIGRLIMTVVMGFLILSFAIWGIGDMFRGFGSNNVATVGDVKLTAEQVRAAYQNALTREQRARRQAISNEQARALGIDTAVVSRLVTESLLDQKARKLGLAISDADIARAIQSDPSFQGADGRFDRNRFDAAIRDAGYNELGFVREQRAVYLRREIGEAVAGGVEPPQALLAAIDRYRAETRVVEAITFPPAAAGEIPAPTAEQLQKYFDDRKDNFRAPAYRKLAVLAVTPATVAKPGDVAADEVARVYEQTKTQRFGAPEKRRVLQIVFPDETQAKAAAEKIAAGASFESVAAERGVKDADLDLGARSRAEFFDKAVGDAAFALAAGAVSAPVKGNFGVVLLKLLEITPENVRPLAEVEVELRAELARQKSADVVRDLHDKIEDQRASGKPLAEAAKAVGLEPRLIEAIDATGRDKAGAPVTGLIEPASLLKAAFASDIGVDNEAIATPDRGYVWFEVQGVEAARARTLDEVRAIVERNWRDDEIARRLQTKTADIVKQIAGGATLESIAAAEKLAVERFEGVTRGAGAKGLSASAMAQIFNVKAGEAGSAATDEGGRMVFVVRQSAVPAYDAAAQVSRQIADQMRVALPDDVLTQYLSQLQSDAKVALDETAIRRAISGGDQN